MVVVALVGVAVGVGGCGGSTTKSDQGRAIAEQAGLPQEVADFFALAARGTDATYRSTVATTDASGKPIQITTTQRPPDVRVDTFNADGSIDSTMSVGGKSYQCTMAANHWDCGDLGSASTPSNGVFSSAAVQSAIDQFRQRAADYDFRVEGRTIVDVNAHCLITTRRAGLDQSSALGASGTLCVSDEGVVLQIEGAVGTVAATSYSTTIPSDAFNLPAPTSTASTTSTTAN